MNYKQQNIWEIVLLSSFSSYTLKTYLKEIQFLADINTFKGTKNNFKLSVRYIDFLFCSKQNFIFHMVFKVPIWLPIFPGVSKP